MKHSTAVYIREITIPWRLDWIDTKPMKKFSTIMITCFSRGMAIIKFHWSLNAEQFMLRAELSCVIAFSLSPSSLCLGWAHDIITLDIIFWMNAALHLQLIQFQHLYLYENYEKIVFIVLKLLQISREEIMISILH